MTRSPSSSIRPRLLSILSTRLLSRCSPSAVTLLVDLRAAGADHVELVGSIPLKEHHRVRLEALSLGDATELFEFSGAGPLEDGNLRELLHVPSRRNVRPAPADAATGPG